MIKSPSVTVRYAARIKRFHTCRPSFDRSYVIIGIMYGQVRSCCQISASFERLKFRLQPPLRTSIVGDFRWTITPIFSGWNDFSEITSPKRARNSSIRAKAIIGLHRSWQDKDRLEWVSLFKLDFKELLSFFIKVHESISSIFLVSLSKVPKVDLYLLDCLLDCLSGIKFLMFAPKHQNNDIEASTSRFDSESQWFNLQDRRLVREHFSGAKSLPIT